MKENMGVEIFPSLVVWFVAQEVCLEVSSPVQVSLLTHLFAFACSGKVRVSCACVRVCGVNGVVSVPCVGTVAHFLSSE